MILLAIYATIALFVSLFLLCQRYQRDTIHCWTTLVVAVFTSFTVFGSMQRESLDIIVQLVTYNTLGVYIVSTAILIARGNKEKLDWTKSLLFVAKDIRDTNVSLQVTAKSQQDVLADILVSSIQEREKNWYARGVIDALTEQHSPNVPVGSLGAYQSGYDDGTNNGIEALRNY